MKKIVVLFFLFVQCSGIAQTNVLPLTIKVFVDCSNGGECYHEFVRQEIPIVDFVRDRMDADVHVVITTLYNSSGSGQYSLHFIGRNGFEKLNDTLQYAIPPAASEDTQRNLFVAKLKSGLIPYLNKTSQGDHIRITFNTPETKDSQVVKKDPWNYWVFQLSANGYMNGSQNYFSGSFYFNISANKETAKAKTNFYINSSEQLQKYKDGQETYKYSFLDHGIGVQHYSKRTEHWGLGAGADAVNSLFSNYKFKISTTANAEYSIFPYKEFNTKRWVFLYEAGPVYNRYYDSTIYLKTEELVFRHSAGSIFSYIQPWGSSHIGVFWNNYLNDFKKNNLSLNGALQFKITKGLNFAIWGYYSFVHDQINIRKGNIDLNQLLVRNQELLSSFDYNLGIGISYRFGSKFNNAVTPAFRGLNYSINL